MEAPAALARLLPWVPPLFVMVGLLVLLFGSQRFFEMRRRAVKDRRLWGQLTQVGVLFVGLLVWIVVLPIDDALRGDLLGLVGILLSAAIALSSTTFVGNAMAGVLLRVVRSFRLGDFIRVGEHFGRVSERGLFHTELQTEDRDLTTLPNLFLVTQPMTVVDSGGTVISATVSLGYDVPRQEVKAALLAAAARAGLDKPFVQILDLGDFSITYRVAGLLLEVKELLTARSRLRGAVLDTLHATGIEVVSPNFMNQRQLAKEERFIPPSSVAKDVGEVVEGPGPEDMVFEKAESAEVQQRLAEEIEALERRIEDLRKDVPTSDEAADDVGSEEAAELARLREALALLEQAGEAPPGTDS